MSKGKQCVSIKNILQRTLLDIFIVVEIFTATWCTFHSLYQHHNMPLYNTMGIVLA